MTKNQWAIVGALAVCVVLEFCLIGIVAVNRLATPTEQDTGAIVMTPDGQIARADATLTRQAAKSLASTTAPPKNTPTATLVIQPKTPVKPPYDEKADAKRDLAEALKQAKVDHKYVLLDFGGNWCPDCVALSVMMADDEIRPFVEAKYHVVAIDVGMGDKNLDLVATYGNPIDKGVPAIVILNSAGKIVTTSKDGVMSNARTSTKQQILAFLKQWAPK